MTNTKNLVKKALVGTVLVSSLTLSAYAASPASIGRPAFAENSKAEVTYVGIDRNNLLSFNVHYLNLSGKDFSLTILDEIGDVIYKNYYSDKNFNKTFKLPKTEVSKLRFIIEDGKNTFRQKFDVNMETLFNEKVVIKKSN